MNGLGAGGPIRIEVCIRKQFCKKTIRKELQLSQQYRLSFLSYYTSLTLFMNGVISCGLVRIEACIRKQVYKELYLINKFIRKQVDNNIISHIIPH